MFPRDKVSASFERQCHQVFASLIQEVEQEPKGLTMARELHQLEKILVQVEDIGSRSLFDRSVNQLNVPAELRESLQGGDLDLLTRVLEQNFKSLGRLSLPMKQKILALIYKRYPILKIPTKAYPVEMSLDSARVEKELMINRIRQSIQNSSAKEFKPYEARITRNGTLKQMQKEYHGMIPLAKAIEQSREELYDANDDSNKLVDFLTGSGKPIARAGIGSSVNFPNRLKELMLEHVNQGDMFLDIGCGVGAQSYALLQRGAKVVMNEMDARSLIKFMSSVEDIKEASEAPFDYDSAFLSYGPFLDVASQYDDQSFEGIVCNHVLHYMKPQEIRDMFKEMYRLVKPGGRIFIAALTPYHRSFKAVTDESLQKLNGHALWPGEIKNTDKAWIKNTELDPLYNSMRIFPPYMHPQYPKIFAREAKMAKFEVLESGYFGFPPEADLVENDPKGALFKKLLTQGQVGETPFSLYRKDKSIAYLVAMRK